MRIAIGTVPRKDPFGGGNQFARILSKALREENHEVFFDLKTDRLDVILITEPRLWLQASAFGPLEVARYLKKISSTTMVVHRINECDQRKGTNSVNRQLALSNSVADHTVFISEWLRDIFRSCNLTKRQSVIRNGADKDIFNFQKKEVPAKGKKVRIVTHHWSPNQNKGWDIYKLIDDSIDPESYEFHYIGNKPKNIDTKNIVFHDPCANKELSTLLSDNHIYLTASLNEPAGMHHIEGASVGLPLVFRQSGALPEYCNGYGEAFSDIASAWEAIKKIHTNFTDYAGRMQTYPAHSKRMVKEYLDLFECLITEKHQIVRNRSGPSSSVSDVSRILKYYNHYLMHRLGRQ
tara:strand:- start:2304 stop:3353 length:1050 start_codon:yes stop_codon:yes gene_type:complete